MEIYCKPFLIPQTTTFLSSCSQRTFAIQETNRTPTAMTENGNWEAPPQVLVKLNWDTALDKVQCQVGIGAIIRDWRGYVFATPRIKRTLFLDPLLEVTLAGFQATLFCKNIGHKNIMLGDSLQVIQGLKSFVEMASYPRILISKLRLAQCHGSRLANSYLLVNMRHIGNFLLKRAQVNLPLELSLLLPTHLDVLTLTPHPLLDNSYAYTTQRLKRN